MVQRLREWVPAYVVRGGLPGRLQDQNPRPVSAKDAETRTGHPLCDGAGQHRSRWATPDFEIRVPALSLRRTQRQGRGTPCGDGAGIRRSRWATPYFKIRVPALSLRRTQRRGRGTRAR